MDGVESIIIITIGARYIDYEQDLPAIVLGLTEEVYEEQLGVELTTEDFLSQEGLGPQFV